MQLFKIIMKSVVLLCAITLPFVQKNAGSFVRTFQRNTEFFYDSLLISQQILYLLQQINH